MNRTWSTLTANSSRHAGEYFHGRLQALICALLISREQERGFRVFTEQRVLVSLEPRYRIPDVCVKALPHAEVPILERPDLVIEILSPDDRVVEILKKIAIYQDAGIPHIWVADPYERAVFTADPAGVREVTTGVLENDLVGAVDFAALFGRMGTSVAFNGVAASKGPTQGHLLWATVPTRATTGRSRSARRGGTVTTKAIFTVQQPRRPFCRSSGHNNQH